MKKFDFCKDSCLIIGEVAQTHDGSLGMAHALIDAIAEAGADAVKFQTHIASAESSPDEPWRIKFSPQDETRYDYWKRMEFTEEQWLGLKKHAQQRGLIFVGSPFSLEAVELLDHVNIDIWKIASGEVNNIPLLEQILANDKPVIISSGMSSLSEMDLAVDLIKTKKSSFAVLQCTSCYPCPPEKIGLNMISFFRKRYGCKVGLSDHSGKIYPGLAAVTEGAGILEVHVALSREMFGPDVSSSITTSELRQLVEGARFIERMKSNPIDKDDMIDEMALVREMFTKSIFLRLNLPIGTVLKREHLALKKPGSGIPAKLHRKIIGCSLAKTVKSGQMLKHDDLVEKDIF
jgi:N,N'-diacetyllegionaminate synthase